jgi:hypothetical protein
VLIRFTLSGKKTIALLVLVIVVLNTNGQSKKILEVFKLLPADQLFGLTKGTRDSMLKGKTYYPAENDSNSIEAYNYGISNLVKDYMYVSMSYETEQRGTAMIEIRSFKIKDQDLILVSGTGGVWQVNYQQNALAAYIYDQHKKLVPYRKKLLPENQVSIFLKPGIPDSVKKMILNNANLTYNFSKEYPTLALNSQYLLNSPVSRKWLKGSEAEFTWTGDHFIINWIGFYE